MINKNHELPVSRQAKELGISRGSIYYLPRATSVADLALMRRIDELHLDYPFAGSRMLQWLLRAEGHKAGRDIGYCHLEKMHNLEALPPSGFYISCFPHKIRGASAGWTRAVAIFDDALMAATTR